MQESEASRQDEAVVRAGEPEEAAAQAREAEEAPAACAPAGADGPEPPDSEAVETGPLQEELFSPQGELPHSEDEEPGRPAQAGPALGRPTAPPAPAAVHTDTPGATGGSRADEGVRPTSPSSVESSEPRPVGSGLGSSEEPAEPELPLEEPLPQPEEAAAEPQATQPAEECEEAPVAALAGSEPEQAELASGDAELLAVVEAIVYVTEEPVTAAQIAAVVKRSEAEVKAVLEALAAACAAPERGIVVREVAGGYKMATKPEHHEMLRAFAKSLKPPLKLSLAALETLATIAYKQPITAPEIMEIRGVQGAGVLKTLLDRKLIQTAGRKAVVGKPMLYKTSKEFLVQFGLKDLSELPTLKEFEELRRLAASEPEMPSETPAAAEPAGTAAAAAERADGADALADNPAGMTAGADTGSGQAGEAAEDSGLAAVAAAGAETAAGGEQIASEDANAPGTAPEDSGERRGDEPAES